MRQGRRPMTIPRIAASATATTLGAGAAPSMENRPTVPGAGTLAQTVRNPSGVSRVAPLVMGAM